MLKRASSRYSIGDTRSRDWVKIKPEYGDDQTQTIDCAIVGGYRGSGARLNEAMPYSHFLLAVPGDEEEDAEDPSTGELVPRVIYTFARVGSGYSYEELEKLNRILRPLWQKVRLFALCCGGSCLL